VGNVATGATTLAAGTDSQQFCYDEQNRLTWAGSTGTPPCTGTPITPGSLTAAQYSTSYGYDAMNRLKATQLGSYTYGTGLPSSSPIHAATGAGSNGQGGPYYSASYDAVGNMVCRAPTSAPTCSGTVTGQQLTYDAERRLAHWQSSTSTPTSSADYLYDGQRAVWRGDARLAAGAVGPGGGTTPTPTTVYAPASDERVEGALSAVA